LTDWYDIFLLYISRFNYNKPNNRRLTSKFNFTGTVFYLSIAAVKIVWRISGSFLVSRQTNDFPAGSRLDK